VYGIVGFTNKYMERNGIVLIFHDDDPHILKEIKSFFGQMAMKSISNGQ
jgi:hypothetical protein